MSEPGEIQAGTAPESRGRQGNFFPDQPRSFAHLGAGADRIGVVDVGSNTVRMVIFEGGCRSPAMLFNEKVMCGLGARLAETGALDRAGVPRAIEALKRFAAIAHTLHVGALAGIATAAVRDASDGAAFRDRVEAETGIRLEVVSGAREAGLAAQGVLFGNPGAHGVVVDLGGASMELCRIEHGRPGRGVTTPLGPLRFREGRSGGKALDAEFAAQTRHLGDDFRLDGGRLYLVGGAWRALGRAQLERSGYPLRILHEYLLPVAEARDLARWAAASDAATINALAGVSTNRAKVLPVAGRLLRRLIEHLRPGDVKISGFGLREGVCLENMPEALRGQDPLLAACEKQEGLRARAPGFGAELADWALRVLPPRDAAEGRLVTAAARLVDVNWRAHPDYRLIGCWESVTRTAITDAGHIGRAIIGVILAARYKRSRQALATWELARLLDRDSQARATRYGAAFRLGAALSGSSPGVLPDCAVVHAPERLELVAGGVAARFLGEEVEKRLGQLAREMDVNGVIRLAAG